MRREERKQMRKKLTVFNRVLAMFLIVALVLSNLSIGNMEASAETSTTSTWDGSTDTSWYTEDKTQTSYTIDTAEELAGLASLVNAGTSFSGVTITLTTDIDLDNKEWTAIGTTTYKFQGTFDGGGHTISGLYIDSTSDCQGLFGYVNGATIKNVGVINSEVTGSDYVGGVVGWATSSTVENCYNTGDICATSSGAYVGGVVGYAYSSSTVENCYNTGDVSSSNSSYVGGVVGYANNSSTVTNCYYNSDTTGTVTATETDGTALTTSEMIGSSALGNMNLSTEVWETTDSYPVLKSAEVDSDSSVDTKTYSTWTSAGVDATEGTDYSVTSTDDGDEYTIYTAKGLAWVARQVSTGADTFDGDTITLNNDIDLDNGTVDDYGAETVKTTNSWSPIGTLTYNFQGTFDGGKNTVIGLYITGTSSNQQGLFGYVSGATIKNITVKDSSVSGGSYIGAVVGRAGTSSQIINCHNVNTTVSSTSLYVGGVIGFSEGTNYENLGSVENCTNSGNVSNTNSVSGGYVGGVVGYLSYCSISTSSNTGAISGTDAHYIAGVVGYLAFGDITDCENSGDVIGSYGIGGIAGYVSPHGSVSYSITRCENSGDITSNIETNNSYVGGIVGQSNSTNVTFPISYCYNTGTITGNAANVGGILGYAKNWTVTYCYNTGDVSSTGSYVGGVVGYAESLTAGNCYSIGDVSGSSYVGGGIGYSSNSTITNTYYNKDNITYTGTLYSATGVTALTSAEMTGSTALTTMDFSSSDWQVNADVVSDDGLTTYYYYPILTNNTQTSDLAYYYTTVVAKTYSTWAEAGADATEGTDYSVTSTADGDEYTIYTAKGFVWFAEQINTGANKFSGKTVTLASNINLEDVGVTGYGGTIYWEPIGTNYYVFEGIFDGNGYTISGVYVNDAEDSYVGLFRYNRGTIKNLGVINSTITSSEEGIYIGGIVAYNYGTLENCYFSGTITSTVENIYVGGIVGYNSSGTINACYNTGTVEGTASDIGGVVGYSKYGTIINSYNTGTVEGTSETIGGIIGTSSYATTINNCYNSGTVEGTNGDVGGIIGRSSSATIINNCYNSGVITKTSSYTGGIIGYSYYTENIENNYYLEGTADNDIGVFGGEDDGIEKITLSKISDTEDSLNEWVSDNTGSTTYLNWKIDEDGTPSLVTYYSSWEDVADSATNSDYTVDASGNVTIYTAVGMAWLANEVNEGDDYSRKTITLANDIDLTDVNITGYSGTGNTMTGTVSWSPIGTSSNKFQGTFDGGENTVTGLYITGTSSYQGLFGYVSGATIKNITVEDSSVSGVDHIGGVVGYADYTTITSCSSTGEINGEDYIGGIAGNIFGGETTDCSNEGSISGDSYVGGIAGNKVNSTISNCYNTGDVDGSEGVVGGIAGCNDEGTILNCYNTGNIEGSGYVGGIAGNSVGDITNCYNIGDVDGSSNYAGGIVGISAVTSSVTNCYYNSDNITNTLNSTNDGTALTSAEMTGLTTDEDFGMAGFDSTNWTFTADETVTTSSSITDTYTYPVLTNNKQDPAPFAQDITNLYTVDVTLGDNMTSTDDLKQTVEDVTAITSIVITANTGYGFTSDYVNSLSATGITVTRNSSSQITISGTPTADFALTLTGISLSVNAVTPSITDLVGATYTYGATVTALDGTATASDNGTITYKWYSSSNGTDWSEISGETSAKYTPSSKTVGTAYYKVIATNTITDNGDGGTKTATASSTATITTGKITPSVTAPTAIAELTYTGSTQALVTAGSTTGGEMQYSTDGANYSTTIPTATNAGTYTVYYKVVGNDTYSDVSASSVSVIISAKSLSNTDEDETNNVTITGVTSKTYTSSAITQDDMVVTYGSTLVKGTDYEVSYESNTNVGTATVTITFKGNYSGSASTTFSINAKSISTYVISDITDQTYTGFDVEPSITITGLTLDTDYKVSYSSNKDAGTATVTATGTGNYTGSITKDFTIDQATPTVTVEATKDSTNIIAMALSTILGTYEDNYTITAKVTGVNSENPTGTVTIMNGDTAIASNLTVTDGVATYAWTSVTADDYTLTAEFTATENTNYTDATSSAVDYTIEKADQTISIADVGVTYGDDDFTLSVSGTKESASLSYEVTNGTAVSVDSNGKVEILSAGEVTIKVTAAETTNYNSDSETITFEVAQKDITDSDFTFSFDNLVYTGSAITPVTSDLVAGTDYTIVYTDNTNAGTATVTITGINNYDSKIETTFTIAQKQLTVSGTTVADKTYDGTTDVATADITIGTVTGVVGDESAGLSAKATFDSENADTDIDVEVVYSVTNDNYIAPETETVTADIKAKQLTITGTTVDSKTYDGDTTAVVTTGTLADYIADENVEVNAVATFSDKNVGTDKTVIVVYSTTDTNYITPVDDTVYASITAKEITVTPESNQYKYYGEADQTLTYAYDGNLEGVTFSGTLSRENGEALGNYDITIGTLKVDDTNYYVTFVDTVTYEIKEYEADAVEALTDWTNTAELTLTALSGYTISSSDDLSGNTWASEITITATEGEDSTYTYYLKADDTDAISIAKTFTYDNDQTAPTGEITINSNSFKEFINTISFNMFFKNTVDIKITGNDALSGVATVEYQKVASEDVYNKDGTWTEDDSFSVTANDQFVVYARITDNAGNVTIINSDGVTVYTDSAVDTESISFTKLSTADVTADVTTNGNTILAITNNGDTLTSSDYSVSTESNNTTTITFKASYLDTLSSGDYEFTISYNPLGETYVVIADNETPTDTTIALTVFPKSVSEFTIELSSDTKVYDGSVLEPDVTIYDGTTEVSSEYYTVTYSDEVTVGTKVVSIEFSEPYTGTLTKDVTITSASITSSVTATQSTTYNSGEQSPTAPTGTTVNSQTLTVKYQDEDGDYTLTDMPSYETSGIYTVYYELSADNHKTVYGEIEFTINKIQLTWSTDSTVEDKVYDGTTTATVDTAPTLVGIIGDDTAPAITVGTVTFASKNVGTYAVTATGYVVADDTNYIAPTEQPTFANASITAKEIIVTPDSDQYKYYGETDGTLTYDYTGNLEGVTFSGTLSRESGEALGNYDITIGTLKVDDTNYYVTFVDTVTYEIKEYEADASVTALTDWTNTAELTITAPTGYTISSSDDLSGNTWDSSITITATEGEDSTYTYYLKADDTDAISIAKTFTYDNDQTAPTGEITINSNSFKEFINTISFNMFFKNTVDVAITGSDELSGVASIEYQKVSTGETYSADGTWTTKDAFSVTANDQFVVYARITDDAGNVTIINSDGVTVYTDSAVDTESISFTKLSTTDVTADVTTNGNTILAITNGNDTLIAGTDYTVSEESNNITTITFKASYLDTLSSGDYTFTISYNPMGTTYVVIAGNEAPTDTEITLTVSPKSVADFDVELSSYTKVYDGSTLEPTVTVYDGTTEISSDYYTVTYSDEVTVGTKVVSIEFSEPYTGTLTKDVTITNASITPSVTAVQSTTYNSDEQSPTAPTGTTVNSQTLTVKYQDEDGDYTLTDMPSYETSDTYTVYYELSADNHKTVYGEIEFTINKIQLTWSTDSTVEDKVYDGTTTATVDTAPTLVGIIGDDTAPAITVGTVTFASKNVGTYAVTATGYVVADDTNYIAPTEQPTFANASITAKEIIVTPDSDQYKYYGETDGTLTYAYTGNLEGVTFSGTLSRESGEALGNYAITIGTLKVDDTNYYVTFVDTVTYEIKEYEADASVTALTDWTNTAELTLTAPSGYTISSSDDLTGNTWVSEITITATEGEDSTYTYYLKDNTTGAISAEKTFTYDNDQTVPTGEITINSNSFKEFINTISFNMFFKNTVDVAITGSDELSGVASVEYQKVSTGETYSADGTWTTKDAFSVTANDQFVVYARITDNAGNVTIINSDGVTVYTDSAVDTESISFTKLSTADVTADVTTNGNTILAITNNGDTLTSSDYSVSTESNNTTTITFKASYLDTLSSGDYEFTISYNPMGETYVVIAGNEAPTDTTIALTVSPKSVSDFDVELSSYTKVYDGSTLEPDVTVYDGTTEISSDYYTVTYSEEVTVGTKVVSIEFSEPYAGTLTEDVTITKANQVIEITEVTAKTYGDDTFTLAITGQNDTGTVTYSVADDNGVVEITGSTVTIIGAGTVTITATVDGDDNYNGDSATYNLTVAQKTLSVVIDDQEIVRGMSIPTFTSTVSGNVNGDVITVDYSTIIDNMTAGDYTITMTNTSDYPNYDITVTSGTLTITDGYTVSFDDTEVTDIAYGATVSQPTDPTKDGYIFIGWYLGDSEFDFTTVITGDLELTSVWEVEVEKEMEVTGDAEVTIDTEGEQQLLDELFTEEEIALNVEMKVIVQVDIVEVNDMDENAQEEFDSYLETYQSDLDEDEVVIQVIVFDISVIKSLAGVEENITELETPIRITIEIPEEYQADGREFFILRNHDGEITILEDLDDDPTTITIETDRFSNYTLNYVEQVEADIDPTVPEVDIDPTVPEVDIDPTVPEVDIDPTVPDTESDTETDTETDTTIPDTGDHSSPQMMMMIMFVSLLGMLTASKKKLL